MTKAKNVLIACVTVCLMVLAGLPTMSYALASGGNKYSFYPTASAAAIYVDNMISANKTAYVGVSSVGQASGAAGYVDLGVVDTTVADWQTYIQSDVSRNATTYTYDAYVAHMLDRKADGASSGKNVAQYLVEYGRFGRLLSQLGFDNTGDSGIASAPRQISGYLLKSVWYIANGADAIVKWCFDALQTLNPFNFLRNVAIGQGWMGDVGQMPSGNTVNSDGVELGYLEGAHGDLTSSDAELNTQLQDIMGLDAVQGLVDFVAVLYNFCYRNAWLVVVPLLASVFVFVLLISNNRGRAWSFGKRALLVVAMVGLFVPMWGIAYTAALDSMSDAVESDVMSTNEPVSPVNRVVLSTLIDTAGWARTGFDTTGLGLQSDMETVSVGATDSNGGGGTVSLPTETPSAKTINNVRDIALKINEKTKGLNPSANGTISGSGALQMGNAASNVATAGDNGKKAAQELLDSYIDGDMYEAAAYESYVKGSMPDGVAMAEWLQATSNPEAYAEGLATLRGNDSEDGPTITDEGLLKGNPPQRANSVTDNTQLSELYDQFANVNPDDEASMNEIRDKILEILQKELDTSDNDGSSDSRLASITFFGSDAGTSISTIVPKGDLNVSSDGTWTGSLSAIGTYNFLNTRFGSNGFTVYSGANSANTQSRVSHYATSLVGGSVLGLLIAANSIVLLLAIGITAIVYGLSLLFSNLSRSAKLLMALPTASLGFMGSLARVFIVAAMMIVEVFATGMLYVVMRSMLYVINNAMVYMLGDAVTGILQGSTLMGALFTPLMLIVSTILLVVYIVMAIRVRGALTGAMGEALSSLAQRITGTPSKDAPSVALGKAVQGAMLGGAMMAGAGGASGALGAGAAAGLGAGFLSNLGRGETSINGDTIADMNASEANTDNGSRITNQSSVDGDTENKLDKNAGDNAFMTPTGGVEGSERQAGMGLVNGALTGTMSAIGEDTLGDGMMPSTASDMGSANRLMNASFGDTNEMGDTTTDAMSQAAYIEGNRSDATNVGASDAGDGRMTSADMQAGYAYADGADARMIAGQMSSSTATAEGRMDADIFAGKTDMSTLAHDASFATEQATRDVSGTMGAATNAGASAAGTGHMDADYAQMAAYNAQNMASGYGADANAYAQASDGDIHGINGAQSVETNVNASDAGDGRMTSADMRAAQQYGNMYGNMYGDMRASGAMTVDGEMDAQAHINDVVGSTTQGTDTFGGAGVMQSMSNDRAGDMSFQDVNMRPEVYGQSDGYGMAPDVMAPDVYADGSSDGLRESVVAGENTNAEALFEADYESGMGSMSSESHIDGIERQTEIRDAIGYDHAAPQMVEQTQSGSSAMPSQSAEQVGVVINPADAFARRAAQLSGSDQMTQTGFNAGASQVDHMTRVSDRMIDHAPDRPYTPSMRSAAPSGQSQAGGVAPQTESFASAEARARQRLAALGMTDETGGNHSSSMTPFGSTPDTSASRMDV